MAINTKILSAIAGGLLGLAFIFYIVSNAVPIWSKSGSEGSEATLGLWRICASLVGGGKTCGTLPCTGGDGVGQNTCSSKIIAARAFVTLACILSGISVLCLIATAVINGDANRIAVLAAKGLVFACLIMGIIGVAVGISGTINFITGEKLDIGAAAIIGIIAIIINLVGAIVALLIKQQL